MVALWMMIQGSLFGGELKSGGKPQDGSKEILWNQGSYQEAKRHP
jgi:hypothetical protein